MRSPRSDGDGSCCISQQGITQPPRAAADTLAMLAPLLLLLSLRPTVAGLAELARWLEIYEAPAKA